VSLFDKNAGTKIVPAFSFEIFVYECIYNEIYSRCFLSMLKSSQNDGEFIIFHISTGFYNLSTCGKTCGNCE